MIDFGKRAIQHPPIDVPNAPVLGLPDEERLQNLDAGANDHPGHPHTGTSAGCQGIPANQKLGTPDRYYDPCAFALSPAGTFGNLARNTVTGPAFKNVDFAMEKNFPVREGMNLEFRAELFNIFNHANFAAPNGTAFSSTRLRSNNAGRITATATDNRQIQFGLKFSF